MKKQLTKIAILLLFVLFSGCAGVYKPIQPQRLSYTGHDLQNGVKLSYKYDVLRDKDNKKYANREIKKGIKVVAVQIKNNTDSVLNVSRDLIFYSGQTPFIPMEPMAIKNTIQQVVPAFLPYLLLTFVKLIVSDGYTVEVYPIGYVLGPGITLGNVLVSATSNQNLLAELMKHEILGKDIGPGETITGIIGIHGYGYNPLSVKIRN